MYKKYTIPMSIFIVFENINPIIWTSESLTPNSQISYINKGWLIPINLFFKNEIFLQQSQMVENVGLDNTKSSFWKSHNVFLKNKLTIIYIYYFYWIKTQLLLITTLQENKDDFKGKNYTLTQSLKLGSLDKIFKSSGWLEREVGEMFGVKYFNKIDCRRLLLDYTRQENPLLKDYPVEGYNDVFYNLFEDHTILNKSTTVEL